MLWQPLVASDWGGDGGTLGGSRGLLLHPPISTGHLPPTSRLRLAGGWVRVESSGMESCMVVGVKWLPCPVLSQGGVCYGVMVGGGRWRWVEAVKLWPSLQDTPHTFYHFWYILQQTVLQLLHNRPSNIKWRGIHKFIPHKHFWLA